MKFYHRSFLNIEEQGGTTLVEVSINEPRDGKYVDANFYLSDCGRGISLDFGVYTKEQLENNLTKLRRLRRAVEIFEAALLATYKRINPE
jgi:hypothetical protein